MILWSLKFVFIMWILVQDSEISVLKENIIQKDYLTQPLNVLKF